MPFCSNEVWRRIGEVERAEVVDEVNEIERKDWKKGVRRREMGVCDAIVAVAKGGWVGNGHVEVEASWMKLEIIFGMALMHSHALCSLRVKVRPPLPKVSQHQVVPLCFVPRWIFQNIN